MQQQIEFIADLRDKATHRTLKIETDGDSWKGQIKPKIRLKGNWLERAGFKPGGRVEVTCLMAGVMELRSDHLPHPLDVPLSHGNAMKFKVNRYWQLRDTVDVEADSIDEAIDRAHNTDLNELQGHYVQGSLYSDPSTDVLPLLEEGGT